MLARSAYSTRTTTTVRANHETHHVGPPPLHAGCNGTSERRARAPIVQLMATRIFTFTLAHTKDRPRAGQVSDRRNDSVGAFFGWTIGSHYTGATMGMAYGAGVTRKPRTALLLLAACVILGATFESHNVVTTVGTGIIPSQYMTPLGAMVMMLTAALVTAANTWLKLPVSTSQLACFSVVGAALGIGAPVN